MRDDFSHFFFAFFRSCNEVTDNIFFIFSYANQRTAIKGIKLLKLGKPYKKGGSYFMEKITKNNCCGICEEEKDDGIRLYNLFICTECERNIIHTKPKEEKYRYYLKKLKNIHQQTIYS